ncbi:MAG: hypothetical protein KDA70_16335 [Planctomycetaceae bacterium]|nr:hypothetical protein [Planctomycetaceae bacterium]MCA9023101.1 hypothetical protein [Planctomycetaceae bacterium]
MPQIQASVVYKLCVLQVNKPVFSIASPVRIAYLAVKVDNVEFRRRWWQFMHPELDEATEIVAFP